MKMKNKTLIAGVVLILVLVFGLIGWKYLKQPTQEIPPEFREKYNQLNQWLDKKLIEWKPEKYQPMSFCAHHIIASERMLIKDESLDLPFLEMLKETGVDCIRLSIYPYNYEKYTQRYNNLITKIKENNLTLMVAYFVGDLSKGRISSFEEYKQLEINFTKNFIEKHKPDYYAIVTEPITMEKRIKLDQRVKDEEWIGLVEEINKIVKEISPETKTMAAVNDEPGQAELAIRFAQIRDLDVVAFQFYNPFSFQRLEKAVKFAKEQGKETWITETWLGSGGKVETFEGLKIVNPYFNYPFMESLHAKWIKVAVYYAQNHNIDGFTPFFTNLFVHYPATDNLKEAIERSVEAFKAGERTKVFYAYKEVIEEVGKIWSSDDYMNYYIEHYINKQLPQLTKEQINSIINNKSEKLTKKIKDIQDFYTKKQNKVSTSELTSDEKKKALGIIDKILNSIAQLKEDIDMHKNIDIIYSDYNELRSYVIQEYQIQCEIRTKYVEPKYDAFIQKYKPKEYYPMKFSVFADSASYYHNPRSLPLEYIINEIDLLSETGVDMIRIDLVYDFWMDQDNDKSNGIQKDDKTISKIDRAVQEIRNRGKKVYLALYGVENWMQGGSTKDTIGKGKVDFDTWKKMYLGTEGEPGMVETIVSRYNPDYVNLVGEGTWWMQSQINEIRSASDWGKVALKAAKKVKEISPDTFVVVDTIPSTEIIYDPKNNKIDHLNFFKILMAGNNIDAVGIDSFDIYALESINDMLPERNKSKELWIGQTWDSVRGEYKDSLADKYIIASVYYAQSNKMNGYNLFFGKNLHTKDFEKTPAFYTYKQVIEEVRNNVK